MVEANTGSLCLTDSLNNDSLWVDSIVCQPFAVIGFKHKIGIQVWLWVMSYCCWGLWERPFLDVCGRPGQRGHVSMTDGRWWSHTSQGSSRTGSTSFHLWSVSKKGETVSVNPVDWNNWWKKKMVCKQSAMPLCPWAITQQCCFPLKSLNLRADAVLAPSESMQP